MDGNQKIDRFGWYSSNSDQYVIPDEPEKEYTREIKWIQMISNWELWIKNNQSVISRRIKKGIPDAVRSKVWELLTEANITKQKFQNSYEHYLKLPPREDYERIERDLNRTFPQISFFSKPDFIQALQNNLRAYCQFSPDVGYSQGMAFLDAMFLMYFDEETSFWAFNNVMIGKRTNHIGFFQKGAPRLIASTHIFEDLVREDFPSVMSNFENRNIKFHFFCTKWFLPAFLSMEWPSEMQLRIYDMFLYYGLRFLLSFGLVIIKVHKSELKKMSMEELLPLLQNPDKSEKMADWPSIFSKQLPKVFIPKKRYKKFLKKYKIQ
ncbi:TBC domain containing protein [Histomonas meleagridis]|uniref:TBC domain containing protein n=1 Tax=Histomonas meleagridis TaxID=135588 RepID=UPI003559D14E|nr:TBC domain containing protein [Histomonas meleagridis]KAH0800269.1 TBC domain containing protein [Histomonas meleagridis]